MPDHHHSHSHTTQDHKHTQSSHYHSYYDTTYDTYLKQSGTGVNHRNDLREDEIGETRKTGSTSNFIILSVNWICN